MIDVDRSIYIRIEWLFQVRNPTLYRFFIITNDFDGHSSRFDQRSLKAVAIVMFDIFFLHLQQLCYHLCGSNTYVEHQII